MANISLATNRERDTEATENRGSLSLAYITTRKCSTQKQSATVGFGFFSATLSRRLTASQSSTVHATLYAHFAYPFKRQIPRGHPATNNTAVY